MRTTEPWQECDDGAQARKHGEQAPVSQPQAQITREDIVYQWDGGAPHEHEDALDIELHAEEIDGLAVRHEGVETHGEQEANGNTNKVGSADDQVGRRRELIALWEGEAEVEVDNVENPARHGQKENSTEDM